MTNKMKNQIKKLKITANYKAFSLMELLIVIAIIGIMTAVGFVSLTSNKTKTNLETAQREVASTIKLVQSYALQGKKQGASTPCGYGFRFADATNYQIFYNIAAPGKNCDQTNDPAVYPTYLHYKIGTSQPAETGSLKNGVTLSGVTDYTTTEIYWTVPFGNMYDNNGATFSASKTFTLNSSKTVTVSPGGGVAEN
jgi:prepilin-type N-terminal cleavage/methylation domain-containing protein